MVARRKRGEMVKVKVEKTIILSNSTSKTTYQFSLVVLQFKFETVI